MQIPGPAQLVAGIQGVTSVGGTATITSPNGPTVNIEIPGSAGLLGVFNVLAYGAKGDLTERYVDAITSGANLLTSATGTFTNADVGKVMLVLGAGALYGGSFPDALRTTIASVVDAHTVHLADNATTTVTGAATYRYGTDDTAAIQAALTAAGAAAIAHNAAETGKRAMCLIPGGLYAYMLVFVVNVAQQYSQCLFVPDNVDVQGVGMPRLLADSHAFHHYGNGNNLFGGNGSNKSVKGCLIDGGWSSNEFAPGIAFPDALEDFFMFNWGVIDHFEICDNYIVGCWGDSIRVGDSHANYGLIADNYLTLANGQFINVISPADVIVARNRCYDSQAGAGGSSEAIPINEPTGLVIVCDNIIDKAGVIEVAGPPGAHGWTIFANNIVRTISGGGDGIYVTQGVAVGNIVDFATYAANTSRGISVVDGVCANNRIIMNSAAGGSHTGIQIQDPYTTGARSLVIGNQVESDSGTLISGTVDIQGIKNSQIEGNFCCAGRTSINIGGTGVDVLNNRCLGAFTGSTTNSRIRGNTFAVPVSGSNATAFSIYTYLTDGPVLIEDNLFDLTVNTGPDSSGIWLRQNDGTEAGAYIRRNTILGSPGIGVLNTDAPRTGGDIWQDNVILLGGTLTLKATQLFKRASGGLTALTYGTSVATDSTVGEVFTLAVTNGTAFTMAAPSGAQRGMLITYSILNSSGGAMGTVTWNSAFKLDATGWTSPANGKSRTISFFYDGSNWRQAAPTTADIT